MLKGNNNTFYFVVGLKNMNTANNKRRQQSTVSIIRAYLNLVVSRNDIKSISVSDICKKAGINRTTFYAHFLDMDDLLRTVYERMLEEYLKVFQTETDSGTHSFDFNKLFTNIKENQIFYRIYFKLGFDFKDIFIQNGSLDIASRFYSDLDHLDYHIAFFEAGITAIIRKWLDGGCQETPETISKILGDEYTKKNTY